MTQTGTDNRFTAQHHALLFACISKEVIHQIGEEHGEKLIMENALTDFVKFSSKDHIGIIKKYLDIDFDKLPQ